MTKLQCINNEVAVTVDNQRYIAHLKDGVINVPRKVADKIVEEFPDWGKASPPGQEEDDG